MNQGRKKYFSVYSSLVLIAAVIFSGCTKDPGFSEKAKPEITIHSTDSRLQSNAIHFVKDTVYVLATNLTREAGQLLSIEAGTLIKVNDKISITINPGATIESNGTATEPVVFTSSGNTGGVGYPSPRFWHGIHIYGNYLTSGASSGKLNYTRIEFAGGDAGGLPSLLLNNVTKETSLENIQISYSFSIDSPSFEFYGGNVNASNLVSYASAGSDFYIREGYKGMLQNLLAWRHAYFPGVNSTTSLPLAGLRIEGDKTFPLITNMTVAGPDNQKGTSTQYTSSYGPRAALITGSGTKFSIRNSVLFGFPLAGFYLNDESTALSLIGGESTFTHSIVHSNDSSGVFFLPDHIYPPYKSEHLKAFMMQPAFANQIFYSSDEFMLTDPFNYDNNPDALPKSGSLLLSGADFDSPVYNDPFFKKVSYRGALGTDNWMQGWTNFSPLRTNYNN